MVRWLLLGVIGLLACVAPRAPAPASANRPQVPAWRRSCSEYARAPVRIDYEDAPGGAAITYRTKGDVAALRRRTQEVARFHNSAESKLGALHDLTSIPHRAHVETLEDGARLVLVVKGARRRAMDMLRIHVQQDVATLRRSGCGTGQEAL